MKIYDLPNLEGHFGPYGGTFVAETLIDALDELRTSPALALDYLDLADGTTLAPIADDQPPTAARSGELLISIAAVVDGVRLIDACTLSVAK